MEAIAKIAGDLRRFYVLLGRLAERTGGPRTLGPTDGRMVWPQRGVYFFLEPGEVRSGSGSGPRVVRVGAHALRSGSQSTLWGRLAQHRGSPEGGNHRGSIFRLLIGLAIQSREPRSVIESWSKGASAPRETVEAEREMESTVSAVLGRMQVLWLPIDDEPGPDSLRGSVERNSIALLSSYRSPEIDQPSADWLGRHCPKDRVRRSGLWNSDHVDEEVDTTFLDTLERLIDNGSPKSMVESPAAADYNPVANGAGEVTNMDVNDYYNKLRVNLHRPPHSSKASPAQGNTQCIIEALRQQSDLDDDELSRRSGVTPRQQVNIICRRLEQQGILKRFAGAKGKIVNRLTDPARFGQHLPVSTEPGGAVTGSRPSDNCGRGTYMSATAPLRPNVAITIDPNVRPTLLIIPCASGKAEGSGPADSNTSLLDELPFELAQRLVSARRDVAEVARLDERALMPAWRRYSGTLYQCAFPPSLDPSGEGWFKHLLILSGGYGVVRAVDPIGTYNLPMKQALWPGGLLQEVVAAYARRHEIQRVVALVSDPTDYAKILRKIDWRGAGVTDALLLTPESSTGAMVKAPRAIGEALRVLTGRGWEASWQSSDGLRMWVHTLA